MTKEEMIAAIRKYGESARGIPQKSRDRDDAIREKFGKLLSGRTMIYEKTRSAIVKEYERDMEALRAHQDMELKDAYQECMKEVSENAMQMFALVAGVELPKE